MMRCFSLCIFGVVLSVLAINSHAELYSATIIKNNDVDACTDKNGDINSECLGSLSKRTEKELNDEYQNKLKEISNNDDNQWWMGDKERREEMKKSFILSQSLWLKYRQAYCQAASAGAEGVDGYGSIALSCQVNMAIRRIEEIRMVHPDLSEG
ncbi:lysozyme inhibitor LprI family protein [Lelliottia sp. CFBP8978]|uniref:lysozyme inhibitor LprI family protein n=1 Tax=Lelliottia sp. CFBP8978 TaxID=3096522 RepID=UPI002A6A3A64|nr:lysozyme inhibitor LprI family protein [Lelliottia sp. CFBP8978]MDY1038267.1 lysozyme inhibitor LprI family protein [Lelliottia sp. CFBP8978]